MRLIAIILVAVAISSCATPYAPQGYRGGFSEVQLNSNTFRVTFRGNSSTSSERARDFCHLRSAELATQGGFRFYTVAESEEYASTREHTTPLRAVTRTNTTAEHNGYSTWTSRGTATTRFRGGNTYTFSSPRRVQVIQCFNSPPESDSTVYDAEVVSASIAKKYKL